MELDFHARFKQSIEEIDKTGTEYATARAKSYYSQEMSKVILAKIQKSLGEIPVGRAEITARASDDYVAHIKETSEAIKQEHLCKNKLEVAKAKFEGNRSLSSLEKRLIEKT